MIGSMWSYFLFCIFDDIVKVAGCVFINTCFYKYIL